MKKQVKAIMVMLSAVLVLSVGAKNINAANKDNQHKCGLTNICITEAIDPIDKI